MVALLWILWILDRLCRFPFSQVTAVMLGKESGRVFFHLPFRHLAGGARREDPLVSKPSGGSGFSGVVYSKGFAAMGCDNGNIASNIHLPNAVKHTAFGRPKFHFVQKQKQFCPFSVVPFFIIAHDFFRFQKCILNVFSLFFKINISNRLFTMPWPT